MSGWTDFGARWGLLEIGRFSGVDRFAIKFSGLSPYSHAGNNPISFIDINGDSLDVSHLMTNNRAASDDLISSLEHNSGYDLSVDEKTGNVSIIGRLHDANGKKIKGSKLARSVLENLISDSETTVRVLNDPGSGTRVINHENIIRYDSRQMDFLANFTSNDLNKETFGPALNFFHELGHTAYGGSLADPGGKEAYTTSGEIEVIPNKIREQLGRDYGQRMAYRHSVLTTKYGDINYMPFSKKSLSRIKTGLVPESQYHGGF